MMGKVKGPEVMQQLLNNLKDYKDPFFLFLIRQEQFFVKVERFYEVIT